MIEILRKYEIEVVISAVGGATILDQLTLAEAIKAVGSIKVGIMMKLMYINILYIIEFNERVM